MDKYMRTINVVGAVITNEKNEILCALRSDKMSSPGFWEFPGGKVENNEEAKDALEREILEELQCRIRVGDMITETTYEYPDIRVHLTTYHAKIISGKPRATEHEEIRWIRQKQIGALKWAPADIPTVEKLIKAY